jgi:GntR family negative regulator for fad regulon and positive regulator of fabA
MESWNPPPRPTEYTEKALLTAILKGIYPPGSTLPGERDLATQLGVTRPTLREVLVRLGSDGWLTIQHGKLTRINDYWLVGGLNVLSALVRFSDNLPHEFVPNLLVVRLDMAPTYARLAVERGAPRVITCLHDSVAEGDSPETFASFDWRLHHTLTVTSGNPIYTLILNGFAGFYEQMACQYFHHAETRQASCQFYKGLLSAAQDNNPASAEHVTRLAMQESLRLWESL